MHSNMIDRSAVLLVGCPNSGKTTLFNWLTGMKNKTVNYPGSTVDYSTGTLRSELDDSNWTVIDTPGTYSLNPKSPEEDVTLHVLENFMNSKALRAVVVVVDATLMSRQLLLVEQLRASGAPVILALTMRDLIEKQGEEIDLLKLSGLLSVPVVAIDGRLGGGLKELIADLKKDFLLRDYQWVESDWSKNLEQDLSRIANIAKTVTKKVRETKALSSREKTAQVDRWILNPWLGPVIFFVLMATLFISVFWLAQPLMDSVDTGISSLAALVSENLPETLVTRFLSDGVIASLGSVLVFCPQIFILFFGLGLLEDSGYLARAAAWMDLPMKKIGLNGRSFVPLMSGFACAVPAMMAARNINSRKERWLTLLVLPLMSCSARLPVYALLLSFLFYASPFKGGVVLALLYLGGVIVASLISALLFRWLKPDPHSFFVMELPHYRMPNF